MDDNQNTNPLSPPPSPAEALRNRLVSRLPEEWQSKITEHMPGLQNKAQTSLQGAGEFLGPLWLELKGIFASLTRKVAASGPSATVGGTFRHLCFVGLNRSELLLGGETVPVFNDSWADLTGDNIKRNTALMFFAPRGLDGKPVNPYLFLVGENVPEDEDAADPNAIALAQQTVGPMALLDLCRIPRATPNTVNLLLVADTLFHWDVKDNYVLPTTPTSWVRDVEHVLKSYPRTTRANLYTQWETDLLPPSDRITVHQLREFPLDDETWLNKPTFQERYGNHALFLGITMSALAWGGLFWQGRSLNELADQLNIIEQQIPRQGQFSDLERAITEQEKMVQKRDLFGLVVKDTARAIEKSGIQITSFEVRVTEPEQPPKNYVITIDAKAEAYQGWLQQEPIARSLILNSAVLDAIRKPPTTSGFKLEALVDANNLLRDYKPYSGRVKVIPKSRDETISTQQTAVQPQATEAVSTTEAAGAETAEPHAGPEQTEEVQQ